MNVRIGNKGVNFSHQEPFLPIKECSCGGEARMAFVAHEVRAEDFYICDLHENKLGEMWPHDAIALAVYFCKKCLKPTVDFNQA